MSTAQRPPAPALRLTAIGSGRVIDLATPPAALLLICFAQATQHGIEAIENAVRGRFPSSRDVLVGHLVDLHHVPRLFHRAAEGILDSEYRKAVEALAAGQDPHDSVLIFADWDAAGVRSLGLDEVDKRQGIAVIDAAGCLVGIHQGEGVVAAALNLVAAALGSEPGA